MIDGITKEEASRLFEDYSPLVYRIALMLTKSTALADDVVQETFIRIFEKYHLYDRSKPLQPWVCKVAMNTARNLMRKHKWQKLTGWFPVRETTGSAEQAHLQNETSRELWGVIEKLPLKSKEIVILRYYADMPLQDIANTLGIPIGTCKSRLHMAVRRLQKETKQLSFHPLVEDGGVQ